MDKIFTPNRWFVSFCALLVVAVFAWNFTRDQLILEEAKLIGRQEAEWSWPSQGISTNVDDIQAKILKRTEIYAQVGVKGKQKIIMQTPESASQTAAQPPAGAETATKESGDTNTSAGANQTASASAPSNSTSDFKAVLTLYKQGKSRVWLLGKVEGQ
jgi:hypothetical protein